MSSQQYRSTRSSSTSQLSFEEAVMTGLAPDGGLFLPSVIPQLPETFLTEWKDLSFQELAFKILRLYINPQEIDDAGLQTLISKSYSTFRSPKVTPLHKIYNDINILELFHGPTYAFKDVALQFVGNLFEYFLTRKNAHLAADSKDRHHITVVGATSGDTGSAAIYGLRNKKDVSVFILYPTGKISAIQEEQMTTVEDANVHTLSVTGNFDDCQGIVKEIFGDVEFNSKYHVGAINSINWARILAQITYYFYSYFELLRSSNKSPEELKVKYVVPSGNFGDILAGYFAKKMGLPIAKLVIATNENDILDRFMKSGKYEKESSEVKATYSPAMDILISSNFERLLWYLVRNNLGNDQAAADLQAGETLNNWMKDLKAGKPIEVDAKTLEAARADFDSERVSNSETIETIKLVYRESSQSYVIDPHTAVGVKATHLQKAKDTESFDYVSLSTAHPAKFSDAVSKALSTFSGYNFEADVLPAELKALSTKEKRIKLVPNPSVKVVEDIIVEELAKENA
ncbi:threonine synthase [Saccharomycopsis crataegensis]|uniref:Threonine synthase n=1 Tax=Saccharomycopsis crataegensis TaxID=43959 RepID=A0AAV5QU10_9ASCO|nr:threonine synthase [Saccharomycopsis crataegensis]